MGSRGGGFSSPENDSLKEKALRKVKESGQEGVMKLQRANRRKVVSSRKRLVN